MKAFLGPKSGVLGGAVPDGRQHEDQAENPKKNARRRVSEDSKRIKSKRQELKIKRQELSQINTEFHAAKEQAESIELKKREKRIQQEIFRLKDERDPPPERIETAHLRQLPDFVVIGKQRGGTTSLYRYLAAHPDVDAAFRKEVHYFDRYYEKGVDWYLGQFPVRGEAPVVGEASPNYLFHPDVPERAREAVPHAKFIALLRNPVDRAYSPTARIRITI